MRHPTYDYSEPGVYFVTIRVQGRRYAFGDVRDGAMVQSSAGVHAEARLRDLGDRFPTILVDCFVVMPNHVHALLMLRAESLSDLGTGAMNRAATVGLGGNPQREDGREGAMNRAATGDQGSVSPSMPKLGDVVRTYKALTTRAIRADADVAFSWQSDYHDRIVRTERELAAIREYVANNPLRWEMDAFNEAPPPTPSPSPPAGRG